MLAQAAVVWTLVGGGALEVRSDTGALYRAPTTSTGPALVITTVGPYADTSTVRISSGGETVDGVPFGWSQTPVTSLGGLYLYSLLPYHKGVLNDLPEIKRRGARVSLNLTGPGTCTLDAAGQFQYTLWEACHDAVAVPNRIRINAYADSGTVSDNYILDEPNHPSRWGPRGVTQAQVEQMCAHSKQLFPRLPCSIRASPEWLAQARITYVALDGAWAQWRHGRAPTVEQYAKQHAEGARALGLWLAFACNVLDGGDGSSGIIRSRKNNGDPLWEMTGLEALKCGKAGLTVRPCVLGGFRYDAVWLNRPTNRVMTDSLAILARQQQRDCA